MNDYDGLIGAIVVFAIILIACFHFSLFAGIGWFRVRFIRIKTLATKPKFLKRINENDTDNWAEEHGLSFAGFVGIYGEPHAAWFFADRSLFLMKSVEGKRHAQEIELMTRFPDDITLSTSNTTDETNGFPPPPGTYQQIFPRKPLDELWERHCEAERFLVEKCGVVFTPRLPDIVWPEADHIYHSRQISDAALHAEMIDRVKANPFAVLYDGDEDVSPQRNSDSFSQAGVRLVQQNLRRSFRAQSRYMVGLFQWRWLLWMYWLLIRYRRIRNQTVEQLIAKGWYKSPQHLPPNYRKWYK